MVDQAQQEHLSTTLQGTASAPGKIIISGEHSVVYGHPVLGIAVNKRVKAHFKAVRHPQAAEKQITVNCVFVQGPASETTQIIDATIGTSSDLAFRVRNNMANDAREEEAKESGGSGSAGKANLINEFKLLEHVYEDVLKLAELHELAPKAGSVEVTLSSEIPLGSGMGSSAAWGASLSAALLHSLYFLLTADGSRFGDGEREKEHVWAYTNFIEQLYHGRPSGCDAAISMNGGCIYFKRNAPPALAEIKKLPRESCKIEQQNMIVVNTNAPKNTKLLVQKVKAFKEGNPEEFTELMNTLGDVTSEIVECLQETVVDKFAFLDYISMNQQYLQDIGVSSPQIDDVVSTMMQREVHGKLTGAGGGGCVIGFPKDPKSLDYAALTNELTAKGFTVLEDISLSEQGFVCELEADTNPRL